MPLSTLRFQYQKIGYSAYLGHLEMVKIFERAFHRMGVPVDYTGGFNPTVKLNFAAPLSVGFESVYEVAELEIKSSFDWSKGNPNLPKGMSILGIKKVESGRSLMSKTAFSAYDIFLKAAQVTQVQDAFENICTCQTYPIQKKTKKGMSTIDMKSYIQDMTWTLKTQAFPSSLFEEGDYQCIELVVQTGNNGALNPRLLMNELPIDVTDYLIRRTKIYNNNMSELYND